LSQSFDVRRLPAHAPFALRGQEPGFATAGIRRVLFPSDLSPSSDRALDHAQLIAERFDARLTLYHVVEAPSPSGPLTWNPGREAARRAEERAREHLERRAARFHVPYSVVVYQRPSAPRALLRYISATRPDVTVMATHGRDGLLHLVLGSVTESVLNGTHRPVLCVRAPDHGVALPYRRVVVPTDLTPASRRAFTLAAHLARAFDAEVVAVHVSPPPTVASLVGVPEAVEAATVEESDVWEFLQPDFGGLRATVRVPGGAPAEAIVETARLEKADVIVMSTHGHDSLADRVRGSHTERVVRHASCPVLAM
jgi:nucleotide-binding universal stress UspA family protein